MGIDMMNAMPTDEWEWPSKVHRSPSSLGGPLAAPSNSAEFTASTASTNVSLCDCEQTHSTGALMSTSERILSETDDIIRRKTSVGVQTGLTCPICRGADVDTQLSPCGHHVHAKCFKQAVQTGLECPTCHHHVDDVHAAYSCPSFLGATISMEKDRRNGASFSTTSPDEEEEDDAFEWGWFEDFDDDEYERSSELALANNGLKGHKAADMYSRRSFPASSLQPAALLNRDNDNTFEVCRTFPPLRPQYDLQYSESTIPWVQSLSSHRHLAVKIQVRSFRIVESAVSKAQHAEFLLELQIEGKYMTTWRRFSRIRDFVNTLSASEYKETMAAWRRVEAAGRWFYRLELSYLHQRCQYLERFAHALLIEAPNAHTLAELFEC